jgi:hypothetical protein
MFSKAGDLRASIYALSISDINLQHLLITKRCYTVKLSTPLYLGHYLGIVRQNGCSLWVWSWYCKAEAFQTRPDVGRNGGGSGNHLGEVLRSMAPWKI